MTLSGHGSARDTWVSSLRADGIRLLDELDPLDAREAEVRETMLRYLHEHPDAWSRQGPAEHFTASVVVLSADERQVLLTHHRKARLWLQLGGHAEPGDHSVYDAATREAREESGLPEVVVGPRLVDIDVHELAGSFGRCRAHLDLRMAATAPLTQPVVSDESIDVRWWDVDDLPRPCGEDVARLIANARLRAG